MAKPIMEKTNGRCSSKFRRGGITLKALGIIVFCVFRTEFVVCDTIAVVDIRLLLVTAVLGDISVDIFFIFLVEHTNLLVTT